MVKLLAYVVRVDVPDGLGTPESDILHICALPDSQKVRGSHGTLTAVLMPY